MAFIVLWLEHLGVLLLAAALVTACVGRWRRRWLRQICWAAATIALLLPIVSLASLAWFVTYMRQAWANHWLAAFLTLILAYLAGALALWLRGFRRRGAATAPAAAAWPRGKLAIALATLAALHLMTLWNMDLASRQQLESLRLEAGMMMQSMAPPQVADAENAAIVYEQAFQAMGPEESWPEAFNQWGHLLRPDDGGFDEPLTPELEQALHDWQSVVELTREATARPGYHVDREYLRTLASLDLGDLQQLSYLATVVALDGAVREKHGDVRGTIEDINTRLAIARHTAAEPITIAVLIATRIERFALGALQGLFDRKLVTAEDLAALRIEAGPSYRSLTGRALRAEEAFWLVTFYDADAGEGGFGRILSWLSGSVGGVENPPIHPLRDRAFAFFHRVFLLPGELNAARQLEAIVHEATKKPYAEAKPLWEKCDLIRCRHGGILLALIVPAFAAFDNAVSQADARRQTARLGVAAFLYRAKNGHFPSQLADLAPEFLPSVPRDPFDDEPMKFKLHEGGMVIYSVGPDLADDGGTPLDRNTSKGDIVFTVPGANE